MKTRPFDLEEYKASVAAGKPLQVGVIWSPGSAPQPLKLVHIGKRIICVDAYELAVTAELDGNIGEISRLVFTSPREFSEEECRQWMVENNFDSLQHSLVALEMVRAFKQQIELAKGGA